MPTFTSKISRMKSVKLSFNKKRSEEEEEQKDQNQSAEHPIYYNKSLSTPEIYQSTVLPVSAKSFTEALNVISKEAKNTQYDDVFDSFFFNDKRCQHRALFMASRLKQSLDINSIRFSSPTLRTSTPIAVQPSQSTPVKASLGSHASMDEPALRTSLDNYTKKPTVDSFWRLVTHRLYTLNYILFVLPSDSECRRQFLNRIEADLATIGDGQELYRVGGMEAHFAVRYALEHKRSRRRKTLLEDAFEAERLQQYGSLPNYRLEDNKTVNQARLIIEQCLESESKLGHAEKDAMYVFHSLRAGLLDAFEPHIELEEDKSLRHRLKRLVEQNKEMTKPTYQNPFEDEECIVTEEDESSNEDKNSREIDSGFFDGWIPTTTKTTT